MKYKIVLFDADGTLYNFDNAAVEALKASFNKYHLGWTENIFEIYENINKNIWIEFEKGNITTTEIKKERFKIFFDILGIFEIDSIQFGKDYLNFLSKNNYLLPPIII